MSIPPLLIPVVEVQPLDLFPSRSEEWSMLNNPPANSTEVTPRIDLAFLQPAISAENLKPLGTPPLRRTLSIVPSSPEDWFNCVHLDLSHVSNSDLAGKQKRKSSF